jgi:putative transposase
LRTASELSAEYGVHPVQISQWKRKLLDRVPKLFETGRAARERGAASGRESALYEQIGRLKMELEWLKKKAAQLQ